MAKFMGEVALSELLEKLQTLNWKVEVVNELPATGEEKVLYLVPLTDTETNNIYAEYIWVNDKWEKLGEKQIEIDLSGYYTKTETDNLLELKADKDDIPTKVSELTNDAGYLAGDDVQEMTAADVDEAWDSVFGE